LHRGCHSLSLGPGAKVRRSLLGGRLGHRVTGRFDRRFTGRLGRRLTGRFAACLGLGRYTVLRRRGLFRLRLGRGFFRRLCGGYGLSRGLDSGGGLSRLFLGLRVRDPKSLLCRCRLLQENPGELGDCLHERVLRVMGGPVKEAQMNFLALRSGLAVLRQWGGIMPRPHARCECHLQAASRLMRTLVVRQV
jgi:hypothetical protein